MTTDSILISILVIHFLADFALQTHEQAINKSISDKWLAYHVLSYTAIWFIYLLGSYNIERVIVFSVITFCLHFITDFITSRVGKPFWSGQDHHNGFVVVGFDQMLHYIQLYLTFKLIS